MASTKPKEINPHIGANYQTLLQAAADGRLALMTLTERVSGKQRHVLVGIRGNETYGITPFGMMFDEEHDNPYEFFNPPVEPVEGDEEPKTTTILDQLTKEQAGGLFMKWMQDHNGMTLQEFFLSAKPTFGMDGAVIVQWCGMWLAVEKDGYCHS